jgi:ankyrin repeat protein
MNGLHERGYLERMCCVFGVLLALLPARAQAEDAAPGRCTAPAHVAQARGDPLLVAAVKAGDLAAARALLDKGADADSSDPDGFSVLDTAITRHHDDIVALLIAKGADVNRPFRGSSPLALAQMSANDAAVEALSKAKARPSDYDLAREELRKRRIRNLKQGLVDAIVKDDRKLLALFLRASLDVNEPIFDGVTPMHVAAKDGSPDTIRFLARCGANLNARTKGGAPVLFFARERPENRAVLVELGAKDEP